MTNLPTVNAHTNVGSVVIVTDIRAGAAQLEVPEGAVQRLIADLYRE